MSLEADRDQSPRQTLTHRQREQGGSIMATPNEVDWDAIIRDPRFQSLHRRKSSFLWGLMAISIAYYFLLPIGAAYFQDLFKIRVWGVINVGLLFALSQFVVAWLIAWIYSRKASQDFDRMAAELAAEFGNPGSHTRAGV
jgi:uncharacterized membrane protein (DUF485 family)